MDDEGNTADASYTGTVPFSICFDGLAALKNPVCMYWDDEKSYWS